MGLHVLSDGPAQVGYGRARLQNLLCPIMGFPGHLTQPGEGVAGLSQGAGAMPVAPVPLVDDVGATGHEVAVLQDALMGLDVEAGVVPVGGRTRSHPVLGVVGAFPARHPLHLGHDFYPGQSGPGNLQHGLKSQIAQLCRPPHQLQLRLALDGSQLRNHVVHPMEAVPQAASQSLVEGSRHGAHPDHSHSFSSQAVLFQDGKGLTGKVAGTLVVSSAPMTRHRVGVDGFDQPHVLDRRHLGSLLEHELHAGGQHHRIAPAGHHHHRFHDPVIVGPSRQVGDMAGLSPLVLARRGIGQQGPQLPVLQKTLHTMVATLKLLPGNRLRFHP